MLRSMSRHFNHLNVNLSLKPIAQSTTNSKQTTENTIKC